MKKYYYYFLTIFFSVKVRSISLEHQKKMNLEDRNKLEEISAIVIQRLYRRHLNTKFPQPIKKKGKWDYPRYIEKENGEEWFGGRRLTIDNKIDEGNDGEIFSGKLGFQDVVAKTGYMHELEQPMLDFLFDVQEKSGIPMAIPMPLEPEYSGIMPKLDRSLGEEKDNLMGNENEGAKKRYKRLVDEKERLVNAMKLSGISHEDDHDDNYMVDKKGILYAIDFGIVEPSSEVGGDILRKKNELEYLKLKFESSHDHSYRDEIKIVENQIKDLENILENEGIKKYKPLPIEVEEYEFMLKEVRNEILKMEDYSSKFPSLEIKSELYKLRIREFYLVNEIGKNTRKYEEEENNRKRSFSMTSEGISLEESSEEVLFGKDGQGSKRVKSEKESLSGESLDLSTNFHKEFSKNFGAAPEPLLYAEE